MTALRGATSAFSTTSPPDAGSQPVKSRIQAMGTAILPATSHHGHRNDAVPSDADSNPPPEVGSVRDKIGIFGATSPVPNSLHNGQNHKNEKSINSVPDPDRKDLKSSVRSPTPQQIAARLATERPPVRDERLSFLAQHKTSRPSSVSSNDNEWMKARQDIDMPAPKPIRSSTGPSPALQKLLQEDVREAPPLPRNPPSIPRKPVTQTTTPTSSQPQPPSLAQIAAVRSSPSPAPSSNSTASRRLPPPLPSKSNTFPIAPAAPHDSSANSRPPSPYPDEKEQRPALPPRPRPGASSPILRGPLKSHTHHGVLPETTGAPKPRMTPSMASLSTVSLNNSSTSTLDRSVSGMDEESLSNAIVASSLASARAPSPTSSKVPPTPPRRRRSRSRSILSLGHRHNNSYDHSRLPSPTKAGGLRQTLRDLPKPESPQKQHNHHHHHKLPINRHPHKHHEGDRKRYQTSITEPERKRYEGVWAANKGLLIPVPPPLPSKVHPSSPSASYYKAAAEKYPPNASEMVLNLVVRDVWSRSQLPANVLGHVWQLVDRKGDGLLRREEFVTGMWLIDQQLKGHKLPAEVPDRVWESARQFPGLVTGPN